MNPDLIAAPIAIENAVQDLVVTTGTPEESIRPCKKIKCSTKNHTEVLVRRGAQSKTFQVGPDQWQVIADKSIVHYQDANGDWQEVDLTIQNAGGRLLVTKAPYQLELLTDRVGYSMTLPDGTSFTIELTQIAGAAVDNTLLKIQQDTVQVFYGGLSPDVMFKIVVRDDRPEIFTQLDTDQAARVFTWLITQQGDFQFTSTGQDANGDSVEFLSERKDVDSASFLYTETFTGRVSRIVDRATRKKDWFIDPAYPVLLDPNVTVAVTANADDGFGYNPFVTETWNSAKMSRVGKATRSYAPGMRFQSVNVPNGATITSAFLQAQVKTVTTTPSGTVKGNKVANAAAWSGADNPRNMAKTTASATWTPTVGVNSVPITGIVQELVNQSGWAANNNMKFGATHAAGNWGGFFFVYDHNTTPAKSAQLIINYAAAAAAVNTVPTLAFMGAG